MSNPSFLVALGAFLGAILDRLRAGRTPFIDEVSTDAAFRDAERFGARLAIFATELRASPVTSIGVLDRYLTEMHELARGRSWEKPFWESLMGFIPTPFPSRIALDLIDRKIGVHYFGHSWQHEDVWWRVADQVPEAVHNLAYSRYIKPEFTEDRVEEVLHAFPWWTEIADILSRYEPSPPTKAAWLVRQLRERHLASDFAGSYAKYRHKWHSAFAAAWDEVIGK